MRWLLVLFLFAVVAGTSLSFTDAELSMAELVLAQGYPLEIHEIETEDHYILTAFRIPYGKNQQPGGPPVILQHGILCSSAAWVIAKPEQALGFILADNGYDVWMTNSRGNTYSKKHKYLNPEKGSDKDIYWNFSFHEMGYYDLPASIDYILNKTGEQKLYYVGHSQGTTQYFAMASTRPEYNEKIRHMSALAPIAFLDHTRGSVRTISMFANILVKTAKLFHMHELFDNSFLVHLLESTACRKTAITRPICDDVLFLIAGYDSQELNVMQTQCVYLTGLFMVNSDLKSSFAIITQTTLVPLITTYTPAGASVKQLEHFAQLITGGTFSMFDYGDDNEKYYDQPAPPQYDLSKITAPVMLHYAYNDWISGVLDVDRLYEHLPNAEKKLVPFKYFNHLDFMWAIDGWVLLYKDVLDAMKKY